MLFVFAEIAVLVFLAETGATELCIRIPETDREGRHVAAALAKKRRAFVDF